MSDERIVALIDTHLARYPEAGIADVYKLLHQGVYGPGHAITSRKTAREWLEHERSVVLPDRLLPLVESVHPEGAVVRVHLRPYLAYRESVVPLLDAFVRSGRRIEGDPALLAAWWGVFESRVASGTRWAERFARREVQLFGQARAAEDWPAMHHSPDFINAYHPAYRVLVRDEAEALCELINAPFDVV